MLTKSGEQGALIKLLDNEEKRTVAGARPPWELLPQPETWFVASLCQRIHFARRIFLHGGEMSCIAMQPKQMRRVDGILHRPQPITVVIESLTIDCDFSGLMYAPTTFPCLCPTSARSRASRALQQRTFLAVCLPPFWPPLSPPLRPREALLLPSSEE
jgi:hypothetical protein